MKRLLLLFAFAALLSAQPRSPELYGSIGVLRGGGDEGSAGTAASYGGMLTVPVARRLAVDLDFQTARFTREIGGTRWSDRRWLIGPSLLYRFGNERVLGFVGGGMGAELNWTPSRDANYRTLHARGGFVVSPLPHLVVRVDFYAAAAHVLPNLGAKLGVGYRF